MDKDPAMTPRPMSPQLDVRTGRRKRGSESKKAYVAQIGVSNTMGPIIVINLPIIRSELIKMYKQAETNNGILIKSGVLLRTHTEIRKLNTNKTKEANSRKYKI